MPETGDAPERCPIGLDAIPEFCSAATCTECLRRREAALDEIVRISEQERLYDWQREKAA